MLTEPGRCKDYSEKTGGVAHASSTPAGACTVMAGGFQTTLKSFVFGLKSGYVARKDSNRIAKG